MKKYIILICLVLMCNLALPRESSSSRGSSSRSSSRSTVVKKPTTNRPPVSKNSTSSRVSTRSKSTSRPTIKPISTPYRPTIKPRPTPSRSTSSRTTINPRSTTSRTTIKPRTTPISRTTTPSRTSTSVIKRSTPSTNISPRVDKSSSKGGTSVRSVDRKHVYKKPQKTHSPKKHYVVPKYHRDHSVKISLNYGYPVGYIYHHGRYSGHWEWIETVRTEGSSYTYIPSSVNVERIWREDINVYVTVTTEIPGHYVGGYRQVRYGHWEWVQDYWGCNYNGLYLNFNYDFNDPRRFLRGSSISVRTSILSRPPKPVGLCLNASFGCLLLN